VVGCEGSPRPGAASIRAVPGRHADLPGSRNIHAVAALLGHANVSTFTAYAEIDWSRLKELVGGWAAGRPAPLGGLVVVKRPAGAGILIKDACLL